jgi:DNA-binding LytR/AlgR family response regulator
MNLHIAVCEDDAAASEYLANLSQNWAASRKINISISVFESAESFLFIYEDGKPVDIMLLDIHMKGIDGLTLAKQLRAAGGRMQMIFVTGTPDFISEGYEVSALHYLMKPIRADKLEAVLDKAAAAAGKREAPVVVDTAEGPIRIFPGDILHAEAFAHITAIKTAGGVVEGRVSIGALEAMLNRDFCRVHRSYLVGLYYIKQITKDAVIMDDGVLIPLSRRRYNAVNKAFIQFYKGYGR